jgi:hypothetical protein
MSGQSGRFVAVPLLRRPLAAVRAPLSATIPPTSTLPIAPR